mgnify:CR=1 FL=1
MAEVPAISPRSFTRSLALVLGFGAVLAPASILWEFWSGDWPPYAHRHPLTVGGNFVYFLFVWWGARASERSVTKETLGRGEPSVDAARMGLLAYLGVFNFAAMAVVYAVHAGSGWAWGAALYTAYLTLVASAILRYRRRIAQAGREV